MVQQSQGELFSHLPEYSHYHRVIRHAEKLWAELACSVLGQDRSRKIIDSKPLPIAKGKRQSWAKMPEARTGFSTMGQVFGFKLHALVNLEGLFESWAIVPANEADVMVARCLLEG